MRVAPTPEESGRSAPGVAEGLSEVVGEFRRHVLDLIRRDRDPEGGGADFAAWSSIYSDHELRLPEAISQGLRGRSDAARGLIERTRGDLTNALRASRLEHRWAKGS